MPRLKVYVKTENPNRMAPVGIHYTILEINDLEPFRRMAERRGLLELGSRFASKEEMQNEGFGGPRIGFGTYNDWDKFIADELKYTDDPEWLSKLNEWKVKYKQFNDHGQTSLSI